MGRNWRQRVSISGSSGIEVLSTHYLHSRNYFFQKTKKKFSHNKKIHTHLFFAQLHFLFFCQKK